MKKLTRGLTLCGVICAVLALPVNVAATGPDCITSLRQSTSTTDVPVRTDASFTVGSDTDAVTFNFSSRAIQKDEGDDRELFNMTISQLADWEPILGPLRRAALEGIKVVVNFDVGTGFVSDIEILYTEERCELPQAQVLTELTGSRPILAR